MEYDVPTFPTPISPATPRAIAEAAALIREGKLVVFPTETVYGLGANALDDFAVSAIFAAKERPRFNPLIVHVLDRLEAVEIVEFNPTARSLSDAFWPGGLTLVLPRREPSPLALLVSAGLDTVAVRSPSHEVARALLDASGVPIAAPSANRSSRISPTTAADVADELGGRVNLILDGGPCTIGLESTVVGFEDSKPVLLRKGAVPREKIERIGGLLSEPTGDAIQSPGQMQSHYAPRARLRLNARDVRDNEALLAFGPELPQGACVMQNLSLRGDLREAASNFFAMLRALDRAGAQTIAVMPIPNSGLGEAINDRLQRAAAPRA
ncbi:MAG: L-threonylcarbamoyladenylate synthase [Alphaproteobacteria bacterium]